MKKFIDQYCKGASLVLILIFGFNLAYCQNQDGQGSTPLTKWIPAFGDPQKSTLYEGGNGMFVVGQCIDPLAKFHIIGNSFVTPALKVDNSYGANEWNTVEISTVKSGQNFGIFQNSSVTFSLINYLSDKLVIGGEATVGTELLNVNGSAFFTNKVQIGDGGSAGTDLLNVNGKASVALGFYLGDEVLDNNLPRPRKTFQCGGTLDIKIVPSTSSSLTDYTVMTIDYDPDKQVHVKGRLSTETFIMTEGAASQRVMVSDANGNASWTDFSNFMDRDWSFDTETGQDLHNNSRNVGINTDFPVDRLQVNSGPEKLGIGSSAGLALGWGTSYIGFNAARGITGWIIDSDATDTPHNGGSVIYGDIFGNILFSAIPSTDLGSTFQQIDDASVFANVKMKLTNSGKLGLGTYSPVASLDVVNAGENMINLTTTGSYQVGIKGNNTANSFALLMNSDGIGQLNENQAPILTFKNGRIAIGNIDVSTLSSPNQLFVERGITTAEMNVTGNVMIGNISNLPTTPDHKLYVENGITTEEVKVKLKEAWSDYVFNEDYDLMSLEALQNYISQHGHLPNVPDAEQVQKEGIELGQMNALLLKKIEELTLYVIELKEEISTLKGN